MSPNASDVRGQLSRITGNCAEGCDQVQRLALEILGHLAAMAESMSPFQTHQALLLWSTVARMLDDEAGGKLCKVAALFAISNQTMGPQLMDTSAPVLAPAVARAMAHDSAVVRKEAARGIHSLLGDAPSAMVGCAAGGKAITAEEDLYWAPSLLRLCMDDCIGVRVEALKAAKRAVPYLNGGEAVAAWVLGTIKGGSLFRGMDRILHHHEELPVSEVPTPSSASITPITGGHGAQSRIAASQTTPSAIRVRHAITVWAIYLSLADFGSLADSRDRSQKGRSLFEEATKKLLSVAKSFKDHRPVVRVEAVEAWEMFVSNCLCKLRNQQASKVAELSLRPFVKLILREKNVIVREAVLSSLARCVACFPSSSLKHLWTLPRKQQQGGKVGLGELLTLTADGRHGEDAQRFCARTLASVLPCMDHSSAGGGSDPSLGQHQHHPTLRRAGLNLAIQMSPLLSTLEAIMNETPPPSPEESVSSVGNMTSLQSSQTSQSQSLDTLDSGAIDSLPTTGLVVRSWCGLAVWAMSDHLCNVTASGVSAPAPESAGPGDTAAGGAADDCHEDRKDGCKGSPLSLIMVWLLPSAPQAHGEDPKDDPGCGLDLSRIRSLAKWKRALLAALIRVLSLFDHCTTENKGISNADPERKGSIARAWLEAGVVPPPRTSSTTQVCDECATAKDVADLIVAQWQGHEQEKGHSDGAGGKKGPSANALPPVWLALLGGVLGGRFGSCCASRVLNTASHDGPREGPELTAHVSTERRRPESVSSSDRVPETSCCVVLPDATLSELLLLTPSGVPVRVLQGLSLGIIVPLETNKSQLLASQHGARLDADKERTRTAHDKKRNAFLIALGRVWRADAARCLSFWKRFQVLRDVDDDTGADDFLKGLQGGLDIPNASPSSSRRHTLAAALVPSDGLLADTSACLRFLLKCAATLLRMSPPLERVNVERVGVVSPKRGTSKGLEKDGSGVEEQSAADAEDSRYSSATGYPIMVTHAGLDAAFGTEAAELWRKLFAARRAHRAGLPVLLKKLAKDSATMAVFASKRNVGAAPAGPGFEQKGDDGVALARHPSVDGPSWGWGLMLSQAQESEAGGDNGIYRQEGDVTDGLRQRPTSVLEHLAPAPPPRCLPVVAAATLTLLRAAVEESNNTTQKSSWEAGLATLAWMLTSTLSAQSTPGPGPKANAGNIGKQAAGSVGSAQGSKASEMGIVDKILECVVQVRRTLEAGAKSTAFPLDEVSLTPLSRLLAVGISRSCSDEHSASAGGRIVASIPVVGDEVRRSVLCALGAGKGPQRRLLALPGLVSALSPMLAAVLDMPRSSYADRLQSALLETWNETFGSLVGMREWKATSVPPYLLRSFSRMAERAEVKMPPGILLQVCPRGGSVNASDCRDLREKQEAAAVGAEAEGEGFLSSSVLGAGAAACAMSRSASDVSATLPAAGARRSFMRSDRSSSSPRSNTPNGTKRSSSPTNEAARSGTAKFVRVVSSGRGTSSGKPKRRAAVTTHTDLDGSQLSWDESSQLPDSEPDSVPEGKLLREELPAVLPPSNGKPPRLPTPGTATHGGHARPSKRMAEDTTDDVTKDNYALPYNDVIRDDGKFARRLRARTTESSGSGASPQPRMDALGSSAITEDERMVATMAAIAKESSASAGEGYHSQIYAPERDIEDRSGVSKPTSHAQYEVGSVEAASVVQDARRLARMLEATRQSMSREQLAEVDGLLRQTLQEVRDT